MTKHRALALGLLGLASTLPLTSLAQGLRPGSKAVPLTGMSRSLSPTSKAALQPAPPAPPPAPAGLRQADHIVALVNSDPITYQELRRRVARVEQQLARQGGPQPSPELLGREMLERLILEKIQLQRATETGLRVDDFSVDQAEQNVARQNSLGVDELRRRLTQEGGNPEQFREELRTQLLLQRLRDREVQPRVRVTDFDIDQFLQERSQADPSQRQINLGHVLVRVPEDASPAVVAERQAKAQQAADRLRAGADFAAVARDFSDAAEGARGGELGLLPVGRYPELFVQSTASTPVGGLVGPVRSPAGFHVLKVLQKVDNALPATVVQNRARHILLRTGPQLTEAAAAARLADYRRRVLRGTDNFATLAREHSQDGSAKQGGELGWASPGRYVPEFEEALARLEPGGISEPVVTRFGVHLIQLQERRETRLSPRDMREMVRDTVREKKLDEAYATWAQELRARAYVEYRDAPAQ